MFVCNVKLNGKNIIKTVFIIISIIITLFFVYSTYKIVSESFKVKDNIDSSDIQKLTTQDYTNVLKSVHENLESYIGKRISFTGYVYRLSDFKDTEFVLARDMVIDKENQALIVGFLSDYKKAEDFEDGAWIEITGEITRGDYHGEIPIIKVLGIKQVEKPEDDLYVYPPDDSYLPTSSMF